MTDNNRPHAGFHSAWGIAAPAEIIVGIPAQRPPDPRACPAHGVHYCEVCAGVDVDDLEVLPIDADRRTLAACRICGAVMRVMDVQRHQLWHDELGRIIDQAAQR